mgnify:CR=1 FL=1
MLNNSTPFYMPVAPSNGNNSNGFWNGDGIWAVIIFALIFGIGHIYVTNKNEIIGGEF